MFTMPKATTDNQKDALVKFYKSMNGVLWKRNSNWLVGDPCQVKKYNSKFIFFNFFILEFLVWNNM
jgi:hypothetical protein